MKNLKIFLGVFVTIFIVASAFTVTHKTAKKTETTTMSFHYKGTTRDISDLKNPANWEVVSGTPGCEGTNAPCVVLYDGDEQAFDHFLVNDVSQASDFNAITQSSQDLPL